MPHSDPRNPGGARHVAIIMDGNGRWAEARGHARIDGHQAGAESVRVVTRHAARIGLEQLTLYAFSAENWRRPADEVAFLMGLLEHYLVDEQGELMENAVRLRSIGRIGGLPAAVQRALAETEARTAGNDGMVLCLALNYGGRQEIADAARRLALDLAAGRLAPDALEGDAVLDQIEARLHQPDMPPLDLLVRTSGEQRLSNYLLWQAAYAELFLTDVEWPEFREEDLETALAAFATRVRRYGGLVKG